MSVRILIGDMTERLKDLPDASVDSCVCDPPYHLTAGKKGGTGEASLNLNSPAGRSRISTGFMGQTWDGGDVAFREETWAEVLRVLKPGAHLIAFSGTRTYHRMACAIEDAGFEVRDQLAWIYGSGFPKSHDVSKQIDKAAGAERKAVGAKRAGIGRNSRSGGEIVGGEAVEAEKVVEITAPATDAAKQWEGWGTALKPAWEPICLARKPLIGTVATNVLAHGTGALNIDGCRIETTEADARDVGRQINRNVRTRDDGYGMNRDGAEVVQSVVPAEGRWPANIIHDGSDEVVAGFPETVESRVAASKSRSNGVLKHGGENARPSHDTATRVTLMEGYSDSGSAARFFYCAKTTTEERGAGNTHPTVKPVALMRWLTRLVTPKGGTVLDPFMGSGSTALACDAEQFNFIGCELSPEYAEIARRRIAAAAGMFADVSVEHAANARAA